MLDSVVFLGLNLDAWITIVTVLSLFLSLLLTKLPEDIVFLGAIAILGLTCGVSALRERALSR